MPTDMGERNAGSARGEAGRKAVLEAALHEFAEHGLEGARTRAIAQRAQQNLATLHYHFGSKEKLYLALARTMAENFSRRLADKWSGAIQALDSGRLDRTEAAKLLSALLETLFDTVVADERTVPMSRIMVREQMAPTAAFDIFFENILEPMHDGLTRLLAVILGRDPAETIVIAQAHALLGQVFVFRAARATVLKRTGWSHIHEEEANVIRAALRANLNAIVAGFTQSKSNAHSI